jgi:hypothetical protein
MDSDTRRGWDVRRLVGYWPDVVIVGALLALFWQHHHFFEEVEYGGDAVEKWQFVRQWSYGNDFSHATWTHHMARVGVNGMAWLVQKAFGTGWRAYYVLPGLMAALQVPFVYLLAKRLNGRLAGLLAVLSILFLAMVHRSASQLLPDGIAGTWAIGACYVYVRFLEADARSKTRWLVGLSVVAFIGYLVKETFVFFYPGLAIAIWLTRRSWRDVAIFAGILLCGLLLETAAYSSFTDYPGRWAIIAAGHLAPDENAEPSDMTFADLFVRFDELHNATKYLLFFGFAAALWHAVLRKEPQPAAKGMVLVGLSHVFFLTFLVKSIEPLDAFQGFDPRYMEPATPFLGVYAGAFVAAVGGALWHDAPKVAWVQRFRPSASPHSSAVWALIAIAAFAHWSRSSQRRNPPVNAFVRGAEISGSMSRTYDRNLPICEKSKKTKVLTAVYDVYLDDKKLARKGKLPDLKEAALYRDGQACLIKDSAVYRKGTLSRLIDEGCYVALKLGRLRNPGTRDIRRSLGFDTPGEPPPHCDARLAELVGGDGARQ